MRRVTKLAAAAAAVVALMGVAPASSNAALLTVNLQVNLGLLTPILTGDTQPLAGTSQVLCSATAPIDSTLSGAFCALGSLEYQYYSRLKTPSGDIVRKQAAVVNVPTPIDVNGDLLPDFIGTLQVLALDKFTLRIDRFLTNVGPSPVSIEAIVNDPTGGSLPRSKINVGFDARNSDAPQTWSATATLPKEADPSLTTINVSTDVLARPTTTTLTTLGGLFNGTADTRSNPMGGRLAYTPVPPNSTVGLTLGKYIEARLGASLPVGLHGDVEIVDSPREQRAAVDIGGLPRQLAVRHTQTAADQRVVNYTSTAPVPSLDATYTDTTAGTLTTKAVVHAKTLPTAMTLQQLSARKATFAANAPLGSVEVGYANGEPKLLNVNQPYARVFDDGTLKSYAGRIDDLLSASFDATTRIDGELQLGPGARKPFKALVDLPGGLHIDGNVSDLPRHLKLVYDQNAGLIDYDAFSETIGQIDVDASQTAPFFGRVTHVVGKINDLPAHATVNIKPDNGGIRLETDNPIGQVQALLTSGPSLSLPAGVFGATIQDKVANFTAFARVKGLRLVDVTTGPGDALTGHVQLASTPLELHHSTDTRQINANLSAIPSDVTLAFDPAAGTVDYDANAGIDQITASVDNSTPLFGEVKHIDATIAQLPSSVDIGFKPASGSGGAFQASPAVGMIEANLTDGVAVAPALPAGESGVNLRDLPGGFALRGRLFQVSGATVTTSGSNLNATLDTGPLPNGGGLQDLHLDLMFDDPTDAVTSPAQITAFVQDLPTHLALTQAAGQTTYDANGTVPLVTLSADNLPGGSSGDSLDGGLHFVRGTLTGVPSHFDIVHSDPTNGVVANGPITRADLEAWDHGPANAAFPEDGRNKLSLNTRDGRLHVQARAFGLKTVKLTDLLGTKVESEFGSTPAPMDITVAGGTSSTASDSDAGPLDIGVGITDLPIKSTFELGTLLGTHIKWTDQNPGTGGTHVNVNLSSKSVGLKNLAITLPATADVCVGGNLDCGPVSPFAWQSGDDVWITPNQFIATSTASGPITVDGKVCLPPTDDDGDTLPFPSNGVYGTCQNDTETNRITIDNLRIHNMRLEFMSGDTQNKDEDGDPVEDDLLKLYFQSDADGLKTDEVHVRNDTSDSTTNIIAGTEGRPAMTHTGDHFLGLYDLSGIPSTEFVTNRLRCDGLDVEVDLPVLGLTDVIPGLAELFIDICE
jgi:hypothetical protein